MTLQIFGSDLRTSVVIKVVKQKGENGTALTEPRKTVKSENLRNEDSMFHRNVCIHTKEHKFSKYRVIQNDCRGFNNLSYTIHLR